MLIMRQYLRQVFIGLLSAVALSACNVTGSPDELIVGDWTQVKTISIVDAGVSLKISESATRYLSDGTLQSSARLKIENVPETLSTYDVKSVGTWKIEKSKLIESIADVDVTTASGTPQATAIARQMTETILTAEPSSVDILALTKTQMTLRETEANYTIRFERR